MGRPDGCGGRSADPGPGGHAPSPFGTFFAVAVVRGGQRVADLSPRRTSPPSLAAVREACPGHSAGDVPGGTVRSYPAAGRVRLGSGF